jgi:hypothetical protein
VCDLKKRFSYDFERKCVSPTFRTYVVCFPDDFPPPEDANFICNIPSVARPNECSRPEPYCRYPFGSLPDLTGPFFAASNIKKGRIYRMSTRPRQENCIPLCMEILRRDKDLNLTLRFYIFDMADIFSKIAVTTLS